MKTKQKIKSRKKYLYCIVAYKKHYEIAFHMTTSKAKADFIARKVWQFTTLQNRKNTTIFVRRYERNEFQELYFNAYCEVVTRIQYK